MKIATWNVNSLRSRLARALAWLEKQRPDVLCIQETKCADDAFPREELEGLGYQVAYTGQRNGLNGVAICARAPIEDVVDHMPTARDDDKQRRFLSARIAGTRVINLYVPNGQQLHSDNFFFKLDWLGRLQRHLVATYDPKADPLVIVGDFNITPDDRDVYDPEILSGQLHHSKHERQALARLVDWGLHDALRVVEPEGRRFSWFDYRATYKTFTDAEGTRIDLIYVTEPLRERVEAVEFDLEERAGEQPSDHAPVILLLQD